MWTMFDAWVGVLVFSLALVCDLAQEAISQPSKRGTRGKSRMKWSGAQGTGFSGDGRNMEHNGPSGIRGHVWYAWVGDLRMSLKGPGGRMEPVNCALVDLPSGKFGTQTTGDSEWQRVRAEFQADPIGHGHRRAKQALAATVAL